MPPGTRHEETGMGFLIRTTFWFSLVLLALPLDSAGQNEGQRQVNAIEAIIAAGEAVTDIAGMCERKPAVCETGRSALSTIGVRAREVSRIAYETLDEGKADAQQTAGKPVETDDTPTGSVLPAEEMVLPTARPTE